MAEVSPWLILAAGAVMSYLPRALGVALSGRIDPGGAVFQWVSCVAYALMAGLVARMIMLPVGPLQATDLASRLASAGLALTVFFILRRNLLLGVSAGTLSLIGLTVGDVHLFRLF